MHRLWVTTLAFYSYVLQAEVSEPIHNEAMGYVGHPHPGQEGDFDDKLPVTSPGTKGKERNKSENSHSHLVSSLTYFVYNYLRPLNMPLCVSIYV